MPVSLSRGACPAPGFEGLQSIACGQAKPHRIGVMWRAELQDVRGSDSSAAVWAVLRLRLAWGAGSRGGG